MSIDVEALRREIEALPNAVVGDYIDRAAVLDVLARLVPAEDKPELVKVPDLGDSPSYFVKATVPAEDEGRDPERMRDPDAWWAGYVAGRKSVPAEDEGRRVSFGKTERRPAVWLDVPAEDEGRLRAARFAAYGHESTCPACHPAEDEGRLREAVEDIIGRMELGNYDAPISVWVKDLRNALAATPEPR